MDRRFGKFGINANLGTAIIDNQYETYTIGGEPFAISKSVHFKEYRYHNTASRKQIP